MKKILQIKHFVNSKIQSQLVDQEDRLIGMLAQFVDKMAYVLPIVEADVPSSYYLDLVNILQILTPLSKVFRIVLVHSYGFNQS